MRQESGNGWLGSMLGRSSSSLSRAGSGLRSISGEKMFDLLNREVSHDPFGILNHQTSGAFSDLDPFDHTSLGRNLSASPRSFSHARTSKDLRQYELDFVQSGRLPDDLKGLSRGQPSVDSLPPLSSVSRDTSMVSRDVSLSRLLSRGTSPGLIHLISGASDSFPPLSPIKTPRKNYPSSPPTPSLSSALRFNGNTPSRRVDGKKPGVKNPHSLRPLLSPPLSPMSSSGLAPRELALDDQALQAEIDKLKAELAAVEQERPPTPPSKSPPMFPMSRLRLQDLPPPRIVHQSQPPPPRSLDMLSEPPRRFNDSRKLLTQLKQLQEVPAVPRAPSIHPPEPPELKEPDLSSLVKLESVLPPPSPVDSKEADDDSKVTVGIYSRAERRAKIDRFKQKKNRRNFDKKILYACRKSFADSRPRVGGRFVARQDKRPASQSFNPMVHDSTLLRDLLALLPLQGNPHDSHHVEDTQALFQQLMLCLPPQDDPQSPSPSFLPYQPLQPPPLMPECSPALATPSTSCPSWPGYQETLPPLPIRSISAP